MRVVILGGGFGGLNAALWLGDKLKATSHEVVLIADKENFLFRPSLIWVPFGERKLSDIIVPMSPVLEKAGVHFIKQKVQRILPKDKSIQLENQKMLNYDFLIVATGALPHYEKIKGLKGNTSSLYQAEEALLTGEQLKNLESGTSIVVGAAQENPGPSIAYEFLFEIDTYLQKQGKKANITYFTYEKRLFEQAGERATDLLEKHMQEKEITYYCDVSIEKVEDHQVFLSNGTILPYSFSVILPPYKGADFIFASSDLEHIDGLIPVNSYLQSIQWDNVYAVGDTNLIQNKQVVKNGRAAELQGNLAAENIYARMLGQTYQMEYEDSFVGVMDIGTDGGLLTIKYPKLKWGSKLLEWATDGDIPHYMKVAFEKYYLWKLRE